MDIKVELLKNEVAEFITNRLNEMDIDADKIAGTAAIKVLSEIKDIIRNDSLSDFDVVERIVEIFEKHHIDAGSRHDFG
ncbi:MAG: hypothetical protein ACI4EA_07225 [Candidatus Ornithomonoglobus sp.]